MRMRLLCRTICILTLAAAAFALPRTATAQASDQNQAVKDRTAAVEAETALIAARTARLDAQVKALNLPSFEGKAEVGDGAGDLEAALMSVEAMRSAAEVIGKRTDAVRAGRPVLLVGGAEELDFAPVTTIRAQLDALTLIFDNAGVKARDGRIAPAAAVAAVSTIAGLLRSDTQLIKADVTLDDSALVTAVAAQMKKSVMLPSAFVADARDEAATSVIAQRWHDLTIRRMLAEEALADIQAQGQSKHEKRRAATLAMAIGQFDAVAKSLTYPDSSGVSPLAAAKRLEKLEQSARFVLRVWVNKAGGTLVKSKNLATFFGLDPLKISAGLIVSFLITDPRTGQPHDGGMIGCRAALTRLRSVQQADWIEQAKASARKPSECA